MAGESIDFGVGLRARKLGTSPDIGRAGLREQPHAQLALQILIKKL